MARYRRKPGTVDAVRWDGDKIDDVKHCGWVVAALNTPPDTAGSMVRNGDVIHVATPCGRMTARPGDWIVRRGNGDLYVCEADVFATVYEPA